MCPDRSTPSLDLILAQESVCTEFQPIISLGERRIVGYDSSFKAHQDDIWFQDHLLLDTARQQQAHTRLVNAYLFSALQTFTQLQLPGSLHVRIPVTWPDQHKLIHQLEILNLPPERLTLELTDWQDAPEMAVLQQRISEYRSHGIRIALNASCPHQAGIHQWLNIRPDYLRLDQGLIHQVHVSPERQTFVTRLIQLAETTATQLHARQIETQDELDTLAQLGINLVQGNFLSIPQAAPITSLGKADRLLNTTLRLLRSDLEPPALSALLIPAPTVLQSTPVAQVFELLREQPTLNSLAVLDPQQQPVGIIHRHLLAKALLKPFATDLLARKPITRLMSPHFLAVDSNQSLHEVSRQLTGRSQLPEESFIITREGQYLGLGRVLDVLRLITDLKVRDARNINPLTRLPGSQMVRQHLDRLLERTMALQVCHIDIDHFKPFNDRYGYAAGDAVLLALTKALRTTDTGVPHGFLGHLGGDDFIWILHTPNWQAVLDTLCDQFSRSTLPFYTDEDRLNGSFMAVNRNGQRIRHPLLSLSIGVIQVERSDCQYLSSDALSIRARMAKRRAKTASGHSIQCLPALEHPGLDILSRPRSSA